MPPEQLEGQETDSRTDIFAFGAVLYEMLTGHKAFEARSQSSVIAAIMHIDPPAISTFQSTTPPALDRIVRICLAKDPDQRWQTAHDLGLQLQWIAEGGSLAGVPAAAAARRTSRDRLPWILFAAALALVLALTVPATRYFLPNPTGQLRLEIDTPPLLPNDYQILISPDGRKVAYVAASGEKRMLFVRPIDSFTAQLIPGTEDALQPFWSPDSRYIAFGASLAAKLKKVDVIGGIPAQTICDLDSTTLNFGGGTWNADA